ncbi:MAG: sulfatase [Candidatus Poribacteria bacterium]
MNIVLIISDTLRRDHLGCYGNEEIHTPHLDKFAERCVVFDRAYTASFPTVPMRADVMTGKWTFTYLGWAPLPRNEVILSQLLSEAGFRTMAVVDTPFLVRQGYGYDRGFHDFRWIRGQGGDRADTNYERRYEEDYCAPMTCAAAERWIERHYKDQFFLYVDTWDPHEPWDPPAHYVELYDKDWDGTIVRPPYWYWKDAGLTERQLQIAHACYCGEVTMVDRWVGRIIERIESLGIMDRTAILFTTDHGFYFGEHGILGKTVMRRGEFRGSPLYEEVAGIPLLVYVPGIEPKRSDALVSAVDLMPTMLELAGVGIPETVQGESFVPLLKGEKETHRQFVVSTTQLQNPGETTQAVDDSQRQIKTYLPATITSEEWSLLYAWEGAQVELYNLKSDPKQQTNVVEDNRELAEEMHRWFYELIKSAGTEERLLEPRAKL